MARGIEFEAGGVTYRLHLGMAAMLRYERRAKEIDGKGESVLAAAQAMQAGDLSVERLLRLFWAGLSPQVETEEAAAEIADEVGMAAAMEMLGRSLDDVMEGFVGEPPGKKPAGASTLKQ